MRSEYDAFAPFYDRVVGSREDVAALLERLVQRYAPRARSILELGCGSGSMLKRLSKRYACVGVDSSRGMLAIAKRKARNAELIRGDITRFDLNRRFDVVLCPFDTINHITSFARWKMVFDNAHRHLNPGGVFIFDVNTERKMEDYRLDPVVADVQPNVVTMVQVGRVRRYHYRVSLKLLERQRGQLFRLREMVLPEIVVPTPRILRQLSINFKRVTLFDPDRKRPSPETEELYFICRDPR